jgi:hypothetical protein
MGLDWLSAAVIVRQPSILRNLLSAHAPHVKEQPDGGVFSGSVNLDRGSRAGNPPALGRASSASRGPLERDVRGRDPRPLHAGDRHSGGGVLGRALPGSFAVRRTHTLSGRRASDASPRGCVPFMWKMGARFPARSQRTQSGHRPLGCQSLAMLTQGCDAS